MGGLGLSSIFNPLFRMSTLHNDSIFEFIVLNGEFIS